MKSLIVGLALLAVVLLAPYAKASSTDLELQKARKARQAQQERIAAELSRIEREAARAVSAVLVPVRQGADLHMRWRRE